MRTRWAIVLLSTGALAVGCGMSGVSAATGGTVRPPATSSSAPIVGKWDQIHTCQQLLRALRKVNLLRLAPSVVGDYFPDKTPQQLVQKKHICQGAKPQRHSHFFTSDSRFGSVDQNDQQVDDGTYSLIGDRELRINNSDFDVRFQYRIAHRKILRLRPLITAAMRQEALAHPLEFTAAGWAVAVSYVGLPWHRVACGKCVEREAAPPSDPRLILAGRT